MIAGVPWWWLVLGFFIGSATTFAVLWFQIRPKS